MIIDFLRKRSAINWKPFSKLFLKDDGSSWVLSREMKSLRVLCEQLKIPIVKSELLRYANNQSVFYASRYELFRSRPWEKNQNRFATAYFHGRPGSGESIFDEMYGILCKSHSQICRVQVSHSEMRDTVLSSGIDPCKVFLIPIGIDISTFPLQTIDSKKNARQKFHIPESAVVVGSFQKDGAGWGEGNEPKLIKGPDIFLATIKEIKEKIPEIYVLLTGPARGYVIKGLKEIQIPYKYIMFDKYEDINSAYDCLDLYIVASRQEGGPKSIFESMAKGIPLVTTRVGQAMDLVKHNENGWVTEIEDFEALAHWAYYAVDNKAGCAKMLNFARKTAEQNTYIAHLPLWEKFMNGFVE